MSIMTFHIEQLAHIDQVLYCLCLQGVPGSACTRTRLLCPVRSTLQVRGQDRVSEGCSSIPWVLTCYKYIDGLFEGVMQLYLMYEYHDHFIKRSCSN